MTSFRRTKIVTTIGPATSPPDVMYRLIEAGADVLRLNFSQGEHAEKRAQIAQARDAAASTGRSITVLQDLQGPKIRVGEVIDEPAVLREGEWIEIHTDGRRGDSHHISISYDNLADEVEPGDPIYLDDGMMELRVEDVAHGVIQASVIRGGHLGSRKGVNLPGVKLRASSLTPKDEEDLRFGLGEGVDLIALSFVRRPEDADRAREIMMEMDCIKPIIAKIEKIEAIGSIDEIIEVFDGIMVARGDLGVEVGPEKVPTLQKQIIYKANAAGKPVITATQMLESMTYARTPTRAEASDVANAVFDGTDAVMLSGETAVGQFPIETVRTMDRIVREAELATGREPVERPAVTSTAALCSAAVHLATDIGATALAALTRDGGTAQILSSLRPSMPVFALSEEHELARRLNLWRGVFPLVIDRAPDIEEASHTIAHELRTRAQLPVGSKVVIVGVPPESTIARTDFIRLITL
jgi:pyruvate kinase